MRYVESVCKYLRTEKNIQNVVNPYIGYFNKYLKCFSKLSLKNKFFSLRTRFIEKYFDILM